MKLFFQRKIRKFAQWLEYETTKWVVPCSSQLCCLIENTDKPNFVEFNRLLDEVEKRWKIYDNEIERYKVICRLAEFKYEHKINEKSSIKSQ